ncbi:unnamed protein product [Durusdinium trenchii]|uniref:DNA helicase n=1 Tax=Durusdinium trenchii TaxID=1381693 RepID=A0ABP0R6B4_9DINO
MLYLFYRAKTGCTVVKHEAGTGALQLDWAVDAGSTCLVVASNAIRDHLRSKGCQATMLTVPEVKGLEFDLVILIHVLGGSSHPWAIGELADENSEGSQMALFAATSDPGDVFLKHSDVFYQMVPAIHELKILYTAITRARFGCVLLETTAKAPWSPLLRHWTQEGAVEYVDSLTAYVHRVETGTTRASPTLPTLEDLNVCPACQAASDSDSGAGPISLPEMVFWLEAEMEAREGRQHRRARVMLRGELQRLEENRPLDAGFCQAFCQSHGMMIEPVFEWRKADQVSEVPKRPKVVQTASSCSTESTSGDVPSLVVFMRQHFQERPVEDLRISLSEVQGHAKQLLMHALDARHERLEIFEEATQAARRGLTLADMVLRVQLQNGGREHAPRQLWSPPQMRSTSAWKDVLAVLLQAASGPKRRSPLAKLRKIVLWEQIFSFLVSHAGCLYDQVCLIAERVAEHAAVRHALLQILVASKAGYKWVSAPRHINLSICKEHLEERGRLLSLHAVRPSWKVWQQNWHRRAALVTYVAWMSLAKYGRCECGRKDETFERCRCMQGDGWRHWRHRTHGRWKHLVLGCHALEAFQKLEALEAQHLQHPRLEHLCRELKVDLWRVREADFRWLWRKADEELEAAEQLLKLQLPKIQKHLSYCFEAGRMFLFAGDVEHASEATTEAGTFVKELLETRNVDWHGPVKKDVASIENHFQSPRWAAWCWTFLAMGDQQRIAAPEAWRQAAAAFRDLSDMHRAAVCSMQGHKWQEALTCLTSHSRFQLDTMGGIIAASCASAMLPKAG